MKLFATDLDGTLLDRDGGIHPRDARAIESAMQRDVVVTIATGRLTSGTHHVARALKLTAPIVCADGGVTACARTEAILDRKPVPTTEVDPILSTILRRGLASFVFTHDAIHSCEKGVDHHAYVRGWSPNITTHADVLDARAWRETPDSAVMVLGIGNEEAVRSVERWIAEACPTLDTLTFSFERSGAWVVRIVASGVSKGAALEALAARLGIAQRDTAVIGDWLNDLSMFGWAGRSYAMPHAAEQVKLAATHRLDEASCKRGAIADALEDFLGGG
ncbi:MAG: HAD hydrolase family protein [Polyangiaceae bacterium]|nr:HAD hydrolase family protein [Polyangiaceae bacterium]